ncbi:RDD family protein [Chryseobacterium sp. MYb328]|uniref:RDD family protein n=1 Tax=Chryseobacterium sp. MYb328 TaxID=2745231 RepID=UPI0030AD35ED
MRKFLKIVEDHKASLGIRFLNNLIDLFILIILNLIITMISDILYALTDIEYFYFYGNSAVWWQFLIGNINCFIYYFSMENFLNGRTIGKYITGTKVISTDATKPTTQQIIYRNLARLVPFDGLSFFGVNGWHDSWTDTRVINIKNYESEKQAKSEIDGLGKKEIA